MNNLKDFASIDFEIANVNRSSVCSVGVVIVKDEKIVDTKTYPYIVIKMEFIDKNVVFQ